MRTTALIVAGLALVLLSGADASAFLSANTIDKVATYDKRGRLVRVTGPVACTRGDRIAIRAAVRQPANAAHARGRWSAPSTW